MDITSVVIGLFLLLLFVGPMSYLALKQKNREKNRTKELLQLAQKAEISLTDMEILSSVSLGLDRASNYLVAIQQSRSKREILLNLKEVRYCQVQRLASTRSVADSVDDIEEINLLFKKAGSDEERINFYQDENDSVTERENRLGLANKWQQLIEKAIK